MKKTKLVLKGTLCCLAAALGLGIAQAGTGTTNLLLNWSFELPGTGKITTGYDTVPYWFSDATATDTGVENGEVPPDGSLWNAYSMASDNVRANQTTTHIIQPGECFLVSLWAKNEWVTTDSYAHTNGYISVALYYGGGPTTVGTPFFTNTFAIVPAPAPQSHTRQADWTNYVFGVIAETIPAAATNQPIGIQIWQSSLQYNSSISSAHGSWLEMDDVQMFGTNGIPPIAKPVVLSPTNSVWGGDTLTFAESAFGSTPLVYQWLTDGGGGGTLTNIDGANSSNLVVTASTTPGTYNYQVIITNNIGSVASSVVSYVVRGLVSPAITKDTGTAEFGPNTNLFAFIGGKVNLYASSDGTPIVTNQWDINTSGTFVTIAGATNFLRVLTNVQSSSAGYYMFGATNEYGSSNSTPAHLTPLADPATPSGIGVTNMYSYCVMTNQPWAYWKFEETNDTIHSSMQAYDYSGHNFNATYGNSDGTLNSGCLDGGGSVAAGGTTGSQYGPNPAADFAGFNGNNGCATMSKGNNNGYLTVPPLNLNTNNNVTFTMWIYINPNSLTITPNAGLLMNRNGSDAAGINFGSLVKTNVNGVDGSSVAELGYVWNTNSATTYGWNSGLYPSPNTWNFVALTITPTSTTMYLYYLGTDPYTFNTTTNLYKATQIINNSAEAFSGGTTWLGSDNWNNGNTFDGSIDEVAVFTNALSEAQIQNLFLRSLGLTTGIPPVLTSQPANTQVFMGQTFAMTAVASGVPSPWYQWQTLSGTAWTSLGTAVGRTPNAATLMYSNFTSLTLTNYRCVATNLYGAVTSGVASVSIIPLNRYNVGWTVNFNVMSAANGGPNAPYVGHGVLGNGINTYWNGLSGGKFANNRPSYWDDGLTPSPINLSATNTGNGNFSSGPPYNNMLLDEYMNFGTNTAIVFTGVPNGRYNLALYGVCGSYANRGTTFTVQGVSQSVINAQDTFLLPDNTVVYSNLLVNSGSLEVDMAPGWDATMGSTNNEGDFCGAQLQFVSGPLLVGMTNKLGLTNILTYYGGFVEQATNIAGPWTTNTTIGAGAYIITNITIPPTRFFRVWTNKPIN